MAVDDHGLVMLGIDFFWSDLKMKPHSRIALFYKYSGVSHSLSSNYNPKALYGPKKYKNLPSFVELSNSLIEV